MATLPKTFGERNLPIWRKEGPHMRPSDFPWDSRFLNPRQPITKIGDAYHAFSRDDVLAVLTSPDCTRDPGLWMGDLSALDLHSVFYFLWLTERRAVGGGPGRHPVLRGLVKDHFLGESIADFEPDIRAIARKLIRGIVENDNGAFDISQDFAYPFALRVICYVIGLSITREQELSLRRWFTELNSVTDFSAAPRQPELDDMIWGLVAERERRPQGELFDKLIAAWRDKRISDRELIGFITGFLVAGTDTTGTAIANAFTLLSQFRHLSAVLRRAASATPDSQTAVERAILETLRYSSPFGHKTLGVQEPVTIGGVELPRHAVVTVWFSSANRDAGVNGTGPFTAPPPDPNDFNPGRWPNRQLSLGSGEHYCLGAQLAQLELRIAFEEIAQVFRGLSFKASSFNRVPGLVDLVTIAAYIYDQKRTSSRLIVASRGWQD
jgi:cytochrome P450